MGLALGLWLCSGLGLGFEIRSETGHGAKDLLAGRSCQPISPNPFFLCVRSKLGIGLKVRV